MMSKKKIKTSEQMVREFHRVVVGADAPEPEVPTAELRDDRLYLRGTLIVEEVTELLAAMCGYHGKTEKAFKNQMKAMWDAMWEQRRSPDLVEIADGCVDSHVVISGTALEFGIPEDAVYVEVHRSNMDKAGGPVRADGKRLKPEGWKPPDVAGVLRSFGWTG
jgi:predicted HAD superfamily Cof-like phosphohydrolase